jgi:hypothetical protein
MVLTAAALGLIVHRHRRRALATLLSIAKFELFLAFETALDIWGTSLPGICMSLLHEPAEPTLQIPDVAVSPCR